MPTAFFFPFSPQSGEKVAEGRMRGLRLILCRTAQFSRKIVTITNTHRQRGRKMTGASLNLNVGNVKRHSSSESSEIVGSDSKCRDPLPNIRSVQHLERYPSTLVAIGPWT